MKQRAQALDFFGTSAAVALYGPARATCRGGGKARRGRIAVRLGRGQRAALRGRGPGRRAGPGRSAALRGRGPGRIATGRRGQARTAGTAIWQSKTAGRQAMTARRRACTWTALGRQTHRGNRSALGRMANLGTARGQRGGNGGRRARRRAAGSGDGCSGARTRRWIQA